MESYVNQILSKGFNLKQVFPEWLDRDIIETRIVQDTWFEVVLADS